MAYIIYNNDGTVLTVIAEGDVDADSTSLSLVGKNLNNYGEYINQNFVKLLNNFSSSAGNEPPSPQPGQLWFNKDTKRLNVYDGTSFKPTYGATVSGTAPVSTSTGDLWFDANNGQLNVWNGSTFKLVGPAVSVADGKFGIEPPTPVINNNISGLPATVSLIYSHGQAAGFVVPTANGGNAFQLSNDDSQTYLNVSGPLFINEGITLFSNLDVRGSLLVQGEYQVPSTKTLTGYADITAFGDPTGADLSPYNTGTVQSRIGTANVFIYEEILPKLFSTTTNYSSYAYSGGAEARVVCYYNTSTSVRRFRIDAVPTSLPVSSSTVFVTLWRDFSLYSTTFGTISTNTNIVI
jgi:hypothetical protein